MLEPMHSSNIRDESMVIAGVNSNKRAFLMLAEFVHQSLSDIINCQKYMLINERYRQLIIKEELDTY